MRRCSLRSWRISSVSVKRFGFGVERVDSLGDGVVFVGDGAVGDAGVDARHAQRAVTQQCGDGLEAHAAVDGLGGQRVPQLVRVHVSEPGARATRLSVRVTM